MGRLKKSRISFLSAAVLSVSLLLAGYYPLTVQEVSAAPPETGAFHLKKYVDVSDRNEATGLKEDTQDPSHPLYGKAVLAGVVYEIYRTHDYRAGKLVEIASGPVAIQNNGEPYKTDSNGEIHITDLPLGQYQFQEVSAPNGVQVNSEVYYFVLPYSLGEETELKYEVYVYPKNVRLTGSLSFQKVGDDGKGGLKNVQFGVYHENGSPVKHTDGTNLTVTTRLSGSAVIEYLQVGKYYLLELENPNAHYMKSSTTKYWFEVYSSSDGVKSRAFYTDASMKEQVKDAEGKDLAEGILINYKIPEVEKTASAKEEQDITDGRVFVDPDGNLYANVDIPYLYTITTTLPKDLAEYTMFEIYDAFTTGNIVLLTDLKDIKPIVLGGDHQPELTAEIDYEVVGEGSGGYRLKFTPKGIALLAAAKCTAVAVTFDAKIPKGYQVEGSIKKGENNDAVVAFATNHSDPATVSSRNMVYPRAGEIIVHKVDRKDEAKLLAGAEFSLTDAAGEEYWGTEFVRYLDVNGNSTEDAKEAATFIFSQLPFGIYTLKETKAPSGYAAKESPEVIELLPEKDKTVTWLSFETYYKNLKTGVEAITSSTPKNSLTPQASSGSKTGGGDAGTTASLRSTKTGDLTNIWHMLALLGASSIVIILICRKRNQMH